MGNNLHVTICRFQESCGNIMFQCRHLMDEDDQQWVRDLPLIMGYLLLISVNINKSTGCLSVVIRFLSGHEYFIIISIIIHYMQPAHLPTVRSPSTYNNGFVGFWINGIGTCLQPSGIRCVNYGQNVSLGFFQLKMSKHYILG